MASLAQRFVRPWLVAAVVAATVFSATSALFASPAREQVGRPRAGDKTGDVVIAYEPGKVSAVARAVRAQGAVVERAYVKPGIVIASAAGSDTAALVRDLEHVPGVRFAEEARVVRASYVPNDPGYRNAPNPPDQWNLRRIGSEAAWDVERGDPSVVVAVVDTGVDQEHPDLVGRLDSVNDTDIITGRSNSDDVYGHGTHVAGIIAANTDNAKYVAGLAHGCTILPVRVLDDKGYGDTTYMALGVIWAADHGADVINISAGGPDGAQFLQYAISYAVNEKDCVVVAASGNTGASRLDYPAAYPEVISVGAVDENAQRWPYSNYAAGLDLMAPGVTHWSSTYPASVTGILSLVTGSGTYANGSMGTMYGTSMAAPHVAAVAALLRSAHPTWSASAVGNRMMDTAEDIGTAGPDLKTAYGLVRADLALGAGDPPQELDDQLPGLPMPTSPVTGIVDAAFDDADIYSLPLLEGQRMTASFKGTSGSRMRLDVFGPDETTLTAEAATTTVSTGDLARLDFTVASGEAGMYSLRVVAEQGGGPYQLAWSRGYVTTTSITAPSSCSWGSSAVVRGSVLGHQDRAVASAPVVLDEWPVGGSGWKLGVARASTDSSGSYSFKTYPKRRTYYRVRFQGSPQEYASTSPVVNVWPRARLSRPVPTTTLIRRNKSFRVTGTLRPKHPAGKRPVRVRAYHLEAGAWVLGRTAYAVSIDQPSYTRYSGSLTLLSRGRWKLVADVKGDSLHTATRSSATYVFVR